MSDFLDLPPWALGHGYEIVPKPKRSSESFAGWRSVPTSVAGSDRNGCALPADEKAGW